VGFLSIQVSGNYRGRLAYNTNVIITMDILKLKSTNLTAPYALCSIFGINLSRSLNLCKQFGLSPRVPVAAIPEKKFLKLKQFIEKNYLIEDKLRFFEGEVFARMDLVKSYKAFRLSRGQPARGQRTRSNAGTPKRLNYHTKKVTKKK